MVGVKKAILIVFGTLLVLVIAGYLAWDTFYGPRAMRLAGDRLLNENYATYQKFVRTYEEAMRADTYGGKTPEETLRLFVEALERNDLELAAKYFMLETNESDPDYLTRKKWENGLRDMEEQGRTAEVIRIVGLAKPYPDDRIDEEDLKFISEDEAGEMLGYIDTQFNRYSGVWKIESM